MKTSSKLLQVNFLWICLLWRWTSALLIFVSFIQRSKDRVDGRVWSNKTLLQHKPNKNLVRELSGNKQDFTWNPNKHLLFLKLLNVRFLWGTVGIDVKTHSRPRTNSFQTSMISPGLSGIIITFFPLTDQWYKDQIWPPHSHSATY